MGNNTNIFPNNIQEFPFPDISLIEQKEIVEAIKSKMNEQNIIKKEIAQKKLDIENFVEEAIKKYQSRNEKGE